jgi:hypothetical protein
LENKITTGSVLNFVVWTLFFSSLHNTIPGCEVEIQAAFKSLLNECRPGGHLPKGGILLWNVGQLAAVSLSRGALPLLLLLVGEEVFGRRVVRLLVPGQPTPKDGWQLGKHPFLIEEG